MAFREIDRARARLFAIDLRLAELDGELRQTQARVHQLESQLEDARLAHLMGDEGADPAAIRPELERSRDALESQQALIASVRRNQWNARVEYALLRARERREARRRAGEAPETAE